MRQYDIFIGIDPDIEKSGFAEVSGGELHNIKTLPFCILCDFLAMYPKDRTLVVIDAYSIPIKSEDAIALLTQELLNLRAAQEKLIKQYKRL